MNEKELEYIKLKIETAKSDISYYEDKLQKAKLTLKVFTHIQDSEK